MIVVSVFALFGIRQANSSKGDLTMENVEALTQGDVGLDCRYVRKTDKCTINVGVKGQVKLLGGTILKANADGIISIDGVVTCSSGGNTACKTVECIDLYTKM